MYIVNIVVLSFLALVLYWNITEGPEGLDVSIIPGLAATALVPITFLVAYFWKGRRLVLRIILTWAAIIYNAACALFVILHALSLNVSQSHPVAFAIVEQVYALPIATLLGINVWVLWGRKKELRQMQHGNIGGDGPPASKV